MHLTPKVASWAIVMILLGSIAATSHAQAPAKPPTPPPAEEKAPEPPPPERRPELMQPAPSKVFKQVTIPLAWKIKDLPDGSQIIEAGPGIDEKSPRVLIEIATAKLPKGVKLQHLVKPLQTSLCEGLKSCDSQSTEAIKHLGMKGHTLEFFLSEEDHRMHYLLILLPWKKKVMIASIAAPVARFEALDAQWLLLEIITSISGS